MTLPIPITKSADEFVVATLEAMLQEAKAGTMSGFVAYCFLGGSEYRVAWAGPQSKCEKIGAVYRVLHEMAGDSEIVTEGGR